MLSTARSIIPIAKGSKKPLVYWKPYQEECPSSEEITQWKANFPGCNWAVVTGKISGVAVLDCDSQEAYDFAQGKGFPAAPTVKTGRGYHIYFKHKDGIRGLQSVAGRKDIQLKSDGGYVLIPPSIHPSGAAYEWFAGKRIDDVILPDLPDWIINEQATERVPFKDLYKGVSEGGRNNALARLAGSWVSTGLSLEECFRMAAAWNQFNDPPLLEDELKNTVESIYKRHYEHNVDLFPDDEFPASIEINDFLEMDIPPVEFIVDHIILKHGRTMISAAPNKGKSLMAQNLALATTSMMNTVLGKFLAKRARVLYLDFEMGESQVKERFKKMLSGDPIGAENLFINCLLGKDILEEKFKQGLEKRIQDLNADLLIIDPIGSAWTGDENDKEQVSRLTSYLDSLISRFKISILFVHHWRKAYQKQKGGGEMAAGSYKFNAWVDVHITLDGEINSLIISCEKARATERFPPIKAKLNTDTMLFEYIGNCEKKYTEETLLELYSGMGKEWVTIPELIEESKKKGLAGKDVIRGLIKKTKKFDVNTSGKAHEIRIKDDYKIDCLC